MLCYVSINNEFVSDLYLYLYSFLIGHTVTYVIYSSFNVQPFPCTVMDVKQRKTKAFWSTYDPDADFERMRQIGVFHSARPDSGIDGMDLTGINLAKK